jgi:hypothetical protein
MVFELLSKTAAAEATVIFPLNIKRFLSQTGLHFGLMTYLYSNSSDTCTLLLFLYLYASAGGI